LSEVDEARVPVDHSCMATPIRCFLGPIQSQKVKACVRQFKRQSAQCRYPRTEQQIHRPELSRTAL